ncbi:MAG: DNA cytosine methyltransferase [Kordiimonadaceae bacterium]|mgnify:CR=1 FL=1|jgi:DNA (cytosine-5)-methyltransferase 1|nr:DNA cytosine methyltransferase [Kordiimonadaceae bacterium]MBT6032143.1 DNA cytosine methyltransferase [Kordiimonadaceae bacterium]
MKNDQLLAIDLFCGAGGLSVGLKKAGFKVLAGVELNLVAAKTYELNHKDHKIYIEDIKKLDPNLVMSELGLKVGELDLLAGCPPCQGFSSHRTRNKTTSIQDDRNELVFEFIRFVEAMKPKSIMMENVPGLASDYRMDEIKEILSGKGYLFNEESISVKNVSDYGVPQRRRRMILQASKLGYIDAPVPFEKKKTVFDTIGSLEKPENSIDKLHNYPINRTDRINKLISLIPKDGGSRSDLPKEYWLPCHIKYPNGYKDVYGRMSWDNVSPTITGGCISPSKGRYDVPLIC